MKLRVQRKRKRDSRDARKRRRIQAIGAVMAIAVTLLLAYQATTALRQGNPVMGENYLGSG